MLGSDGVLTSWDLENWCKDQSIDEKGNEICALDYSHDAKIFATAGKVLVFHLPCFNFYISLF